MRVKVDQVQISAQLTEDVYSSLGGPLFKKGRKINKRDIDILIAFGVSEVSVEQPEDSLLFQQSNKVESKAVKTEPIKTVKPILRIEPGSFMEAYHKILLLVRKEFKNIQGGAQIPVLEFRKGLEQMIPFLTPSNIMLYRKFNEVEDYLFHHSIFVGIFSYMIAKSSQFPSKDTIQIMMAGLLHDIGKLKLDPGLLKKPDKLNTEEFDEIKKHPVIGYNILKNTPGLNEGVLLAALQHHEREDGSGYPLSFAADTIHMYAKIVAIADIFHAMSSNKIYKKGLSPYLVMEQILNDSFGKLNPTLVRNFVQQQAQFSIGTRVRLSNNEEGEIVFHDPSNPTRPWVNIQGRIINLSQDRTLVIDEILL